MIEFSGYKELATSKIRYIYVYKRHRSRRSQIIVTHPMEKKKVAQFAMQDHNIVSEAAEFRMRQNATTHTRSCRVWVLPLQKRRVHIDASLEFRPPVAEALEWHDILSFLRGIGLGEAGEEIKCRADDALRKHLGRDLSLLRIWAHSHERGRLQRRGI